MELKKLKKNLPRFFCSPCDFKCYMKCDWDRHVLTAKHEKVSNGSIFTLFTEKFSCKCGKQFKTQGGLWKHKNKFHEQDDEINGADNKNDDDQIDINSLDSNLVIQLLKQNDEFKSMLLEQNSKMLETFQEVCKNNNTNITNNVNSHNKAFNLNVFLNEECKNAMSITDFVNSIKLQLCDLEAVGKWCC